MVWSICSMRSAIVLTLLIGCSLSLSQAAELEGFDEPVVEDRASRQRHPAQAEYEDLRTTDSATRTDTVTGTGIPAPATKAAPAHRRPVPPMIAGWQAGLNRNNLQFEILAIALLVAYALNVLWGRRQNADLAVAFTQQFISQGSVFERNFSLIGPGDSDEILMGESPNCFKLYASGRRHCQGMLATLNLAPRQDLLSSLYGLLDPRDDVLDIQVYMNETSMPQTVLAVAPPKQMRYMLQDKQDVSTYTKRVAGFEPVGGSAWPKDKLQVQAEHTALFYELFSDSKIASVFSSSDVLRYFRSLHFTSESSEGSHKRVLQFSFRIPPSAARMADISGLINCVPHFIDLVGSYKMPPEAVRKAAAAREKSQAAAASEEEERKKRLEAAQAKKLEKVQAEKDRVAKLSPEAKQRHIDKMAKQAMKDAMKAKMRVKK